MTDFASAPVSPGEVQTRLIAASRLLSAGKPHEAAAMLRVLAQAAPGIAEVHRLLGVALNDARDLPGAEASFRAALSLDPRMARAAVGLAEVLLAREGAEEAATLLEPFVNDQTSNLSLLTYFGLALQGARRTSEAIEVLERATRAAPTSAVADHNLAGALADAQRFADSEAATARARAKGLDAAESWLVHARAACGQGRLEEAEALYTEALRRRPTYTLAAIELAQTVWMRTADSAAGVAVLDEWGLHQPAEPAILRHKAKLLDEAADAPGAYEVLLQALALSDDPTLHVFAAQVIVESDAERALFHARRASEAAPENAAATAALCQVHLAMGNPREAVGIANDLCRRLPEDQYSWALLGTAWRMMGDPRYERLYDYDRFVVPAIIDTPAGWSDLSGYLADLAAAIRPLHHLRGQPIGQSLRHGSQTQVDLTRSPSPAIQAFFAAIDGPIRRYIAALGPGRDPLRGRATGAHGFNGVWSIRLSPGGYHIDHLHPKGWISSACHIELPPAVEVEPEGWLRFGEPGIPTSPRLPPERFVKPKAGQLVLFPSYMWHGTVPFSGDQDRLTIAFDVIPA